MGDRARWPGSCSSPAAVRWLRPARAGLRRRGHRAVRGASRARRSSTPTQRAEQPDHDRDTPGAHAGGRPGAGRRGAWGPSATTTSSGPRSPPTRRASACAPATTPTSRCSTTAPWSPGGACRSTPSARRTTPATPLPRGDDARRRRAPDLVALDADTGERRWCATSSGARWARTTRSRPRSSTTDGRGRARPGHRREGAARPARRRGRLGRLGAHARRRRRRLPRRPRRRHACSRAAGAQFALFDPASLTTAHGRHRARRWSRPATARRSGRAGGRRAPTCTCSGPTPTPASAFVQELRNGRPSRPGCMARRPRRQPALVAVPARGAAFDATLRAGPDPGARRATAGRRTTSRTGAGCGRAPCPRDRSSCPTASSWTASRCSTPTTCCIGGTTALHTLDLTHRRDDLGARCRPTASTPPTGPTRSPSAPG